VSANWKTSPHDSAHSHVQGKSEFIDDRPVLRNELFLSIFYSSKAYAKLLSLDFGAAKKLAGVQGIFTGKDFAHNVWGTIFQDQPLLADHLVQYIGEAIAIVAADSQEIADRARRLIIARYEDLTPILSIQAAKANKSFIGSLRKIERGNVEDVLSKSSHKICGKIHIQGQDHFYLESQAAVAYPLDNGVIEVHSSAQHPTEVQHVVAHGLGLSSHEVVCIVKRMGGAFGGKESQAAPIAAYAALVAQKLNRPARLILNKDDDMILTGKRNPFENEYEVAFDKDGMILALDAQLFSDGGAYADLSTSIMERAMLHSDNAYYIPHFRVKGQVCKTHHHPHTAFRGFGGPKGVLMIEKVIEEVAHALGKDSLEIRKKNSYRPRYDVTPYGQKVENNCLPELFERCEKSSDYNKRRAEIAAYNQKSFQSDGEFFKGLSMTAVKFGISFTTRFLNQGNALVNVYRDGSVQVSTGATEMGQGVYSRIAALVAQELGLPLAQIKVMPTSTEKNANTSPTAASSGTDINGAAAILACQQIKARLSKLFLELQKRKPESWASVTAGLGTQSEIEVENKTDSQNLFLDATYSGVRFEAGFVFEESNASVRLSFNNLCNEAYLNRISLCEYAHYKIPNLSFNKLTGQVHALGTGKNATEQGQLGGAFLYYTQGVAAAEVSINRNTGEVKVLRTDILMDLGRTINEGLDLGQVTGGFVQGLGWMTMENLFYSKEGLLLSHSPSTYKIPTAHDIPRDFRVELLENLGNHANIRGTKAVGEPPLLLAACVWTAIHDAVLAGRGESPTFPELRVPATAERILEALNPAFFSEFRKDSVEKVLK
jgi:xanthine dehydrogenase large subunit